MQAPPDTSPDSLARPAPARFGHPVPSPSTDDFLRWYLDRRAPAASPPPYPGDRRREGQPVEPHRPRRLGARFLERPVAPNAGPGTATGGRKRLGQAEA